MPARTPEETQQLFLQAFDAGDLNGCMALYEPNAALVPQPGQVAVGTTAIRQALTGFLALKGKFTLQPKKVIQAGDTALMLSDWTLSAPQGPDGKPLHMAGRSTDITRRQPDGTWRLVIDNPFGSQAV